MVTIAVMAVVGGLFAQQNDTIVSTKADTVSPKQAMELQEVGISATKPVYMTLSRRVLRQMPYRTRPVWRWMWRGM